MFLGTEAIQKLINNPDIYKYDTVLDIGAGEGQHAKIFAEQNKKVTILDIGNSVYWAERHKDIYNNPNIKIIMGNYINYNFSQQFDLIWCCHVLEHQRNIGKFLEKINRELKDDGILAITVPPMHDMNGNSPDHRMLGGHVSCWNAGLLLYHLVLAGFDCSNAQIKEYDWNISVILRKKQIYIEGLGLSMDKNDIHILSKYFPACISEDKTGNIKEWNW
jgi:SAM-dependent methyltransferase